MRKRKIIILVVLVITGLISCNEKKREALPDDAPTFRVGQTDDEEIEDYKSNASSSKDNDGSMENCPFCGGYGEDSNGSICGFCGGKGKVTAAGASQANHVINGGSVNDLYPSSNSTSNTNSMSSQQKYRICPECNGRESCQVCHGTGEVTYYGQTNICRHCYNTGKCPTCQGQGRLPE